MKEQSIADTVKMSRTDILEVLQRVYVTGQHGLLSTRQVAYLEGEGLIERLADYSYRVTEKGETEWMLPFQKENKTDGKTTKSDPSRLV